MTDARRLCTCFGHGFWLLGLALIVCGIGQFAWLPIGWGCFAFGYRAALTAGDQTK